MTRITKRQNEIFKAHVKAWDEDNFDPPRIEDKSQLIKHLDDGKTLRGVWDYLVDRLPITSQLMISNGVGLRVLSGSAKANLRREFKEFLTNLQIT